MLGAIQGAALPTRSVPRLFSRASLFSTVSSTQALPSLTQEALFLDDEGFAKDNDNSQPQKQQPGGKPFTFPKKGQQLEMFCESLAFKGKGVCKIVDSGFVVLCDRALPGERLIAQITRKKGSYAEAMKIKTISPHDDAVIAPCEHANDCGGCKMQNLSYSAQLRIKEKQVFEVISRLGRFGSASGTIMKGIVGCQSPFGYRNKMEFSFGVKKWIPKSELEELSQMELCQDEFALGLHAPGRFDKILSINKCLLQQDAANKVLALVQHFCELHADELPPYNTFTNTGFLKHLVIRSGREPETGALQLMVNFVTSCYDPTLLQPLVEQVARVPEVVSVVNNTNSRVGNTSLGEEEFVLYGKSTITECINGLVFEISANSFFQTNPRQAEVLYSLVEDAATLKGDGSEIVLDLFCGTGTIGLSLAGRVKHVYGYEVVPEAIADAQRNALRNGITNATFVQGDLNKIRDNFADQFPKPDIVIVA
ncbi:hypothetical protein KP509_04G091400 [Ceratopteris richardii]|uniref:TRAM domain-containing protein n=1 Tax=Ceratopteris richardii TaxID=49495 RepID=A0A8T2V2E0_CERRI|nr:hypothetical protein KP509_04G091400 [Ceratopteris richardii]KAH7440103.1 hypothetical protein KP509_04G091400 [Ceratopteris richardii]